MSCLNLTSLGFAFSANLLLSACYSTTVDVDASSIDASSSAASSPPHQGGSFSFIPSLSISVLSEPSMIVNGVHYPMIYLSCGGESSIHAWIRYRPWVNELGELDMRSTPLSFWDYNPVFFDEVETSFPSGYGTKTKHVHIGDGQYETRSERVGNDPIQTINKILLPKLKSSKTMRIGDRLVFDLDGAKEKIEQLESQCGRMGL